MNDPPTLTAIANPAAINEDASAQTVNFSGVTAGGGETQTLTVTATSSNPALIANPAVTYTSPGTTGSLSYAPAANASGSAVITVTVNDGAASTSQNFTVAVNLVNDAPSFTLPAASSMSAARAVETPPKGSRSWQPIAASADGTKLATVSSPGRIYTSTDAGTRWTPQAAHLNWQCIASSADGSKLVAGVMGGQIYTSPDAGAGWTARSSRKAWRSIASSADGAKLVAAAYRDKLYTSTDSGATWVARESARTWLAVASSSDGVMLAAVTFRGKIYTSNDSGVTWTPREANRNWYGIASSADGAKLAAVVSGGKIYLSTDSGATWTPKESVRAWRSITSSADGLNLAAVVNGGAIHTSTDAGATWALTQNDRAWYTVVPSPDNAKLVAAVTNGQLHTPAGAQGGYTLYTLSSGSNSGPSVTPSFAANISPGPADEAAQKVSFIISNNNNALFTTPPAIAADGALTFTPNPEAAPGTALVTVAAHDDGGTVNGGVDTSAPQTFTITVNDTTPPVLALPATITASATAASGAAVTFSLSASDNSGLTVTPTADRTSGSTFPIGQTQVNVTATDAAGNVASGYFVVRVTPRFTAPGGGNAVSLTAAPLNLTGLVWPAGGVFSGPGVSASGLFDPASVGTGTYTLTYSVSGVSSMVNVTVAAPPVIVPNPVTASVLAFDGVSGAVNAGAGLPLADASFTVELWAKHEGSGADHAVISQGLASAGAGRALFIGFRAANTFSFGFNGDDLTTAAAYPDAGWHHWACTYAAPNRSRKIYRDGALVAGDTAAASYQGSGNLVIGAHNGGTSNFFPGPLGEVRLWNAVRDLRQVSTGMYSSPTGSEAGLVAFWPLDDGAGTTALDMANGHAHPGAIMNAASWLTVPTSFGALLVNLNSAFSDPGATAKNAANTVLTVTSASDVNTSVPGFYGVTYSATDPVTAITATCRRAVEVADYSAPAPPEILSPANGGTVSAPSTVISGLSAPSVTVNVTITGAVGQSVTATADATGHFSTAGLSLPDGVYQASATATNAALRTSGALPAISFWHGSPPNVEPGILLNKTTPAKSGSLFVQTDTLKNTSAAPIAGPIYLVLDNLSPNATLSQTSPVSPTAPTARLAPLGSTCITVLPTGSSLAPGASAAIVLKFANPTNGGISYTGRILSGGLLTP